MEKSKKQPSSQEHKPVGRPRLTNELLDVNLQVRVTKKLADTCKSLGGANFMRPLLEAATQRAMALKKLAPARPGEESEGIKFIDLTVQCCCGLCRKRPVTQRLLREKPRCDFHY